MLIIEINEAPKLIHIAKLTKSQISPPKLFDGCTKLLGTSQNFLCSVINAFSLFISSSRHGHQSSHRWDLSGEIKIEAPFQDEPKMESVHKLA